MICNTPNGAIFYNHYTTSSKHDPTVVYLHGLGGDCRVWDFMINDTLLKGYNFLALDLPGHGLSYRPDIDFNFIHFFTAIDKVLDDLNIRNYDIVGHCLGGIIALRYVSDWQKRPSKIILLNSSNNISFLVGFLAKTIEITNIFPDIYIKQHINHTKYIGTGDFNLKRLFSDISHVGLRSYLRLLASISYIFTNTKLSNVKIPTLIISGSKDKIFSCKHQKLLYQNLANSQLKFINTNHISILNAPKQVNMLIRQFL